MYRPARRSPSFLQRLTPPHRPWTGGRALALGTVLTLGLAGPAFATCPTTVSTEESKALGFALDGFVKDGVSCLRDVKARHGNCEQGKDCFRNRSQIGANHNGSWNIPPMSWAVNAIDNGDNSAEDLLAAYGQNQLTSAHGLWGKELSSWLYWWPLPTLGLAFNNVPDPGVQAALRPLLQAHVGFLSLFSDGQRILTPSVRTLPGSGVHDAALGQDYFFKKAVGIGVTKPTNAGTAPWGWPYRVTDAINHNYMSSTIRTRYAQNFWTGSQINWVVAKLNALGVTTRTQVDIYRYQNGDYGTVLRQNLHGTKDPVYAVSVIGTTIRVLGPERCSGNPQAWFDTTTRHFRNSCGNSILAPPNTPLLYHVRVNSSGVTRIQ